MKTEIIIPGAMKLQSRWMEKNISNPGWTFQQKAKRSRSKNLLKIFPNFTPINELNTDYTFNNN